MDKHHFEQKFRAHLAKNDYSQARLARQLHVSRSTVTKWITGENQIGYEILIQLCELFKLDPSQRTEFMGLAGYQPVVETAPAAVGMLPKRQSYDAILYRKSGNLRKPVHIVGFESVIPHLNSLLDQGQRLLITGYGGTGKTALAATIADKRIEEGKGPVLWLNAHIDAIDILFEALLVPFHTQHEIANLTGDARVHAVRQILEREAIGGVVLDDLKVIHLFSHLRRAIPEGVALWLTSRHTIANVDQIYTMPPLATYDAVSLLASQAANRISCKDDYERDPCALSLCEHLNGHPLGIVIAGAWLKQRELEIAELLKRLTAASTPLLMIEMPPEFQDEGNTTVKVVLDQTYHELSKDSQSVFRSFGVLQEPHSTADFLALYTGLDEWTTHEAIAELIAWNFLEREQENFYAMHDMIHAYAELRTRTIRHIETRRLVETVKAYVTNSATQFLQLHRNLPNLLATAESAVAEDCLAIITRLALDGYQDRYGYRLSYLHLLDRGLNLLFAKEKTAKLSPTESQQLHHLLSKRGNAYFDQTDYTHAVEIYQQALAFAYTEERRAMVLALIGKAQRFVGDRVASENVFQRAYQIARSTPQLFLLSFVLEQQAHAAGYHGDHAIARRVAAEQVDINEQLVLAEPSIENRTRFFYSLNNLATAEMHMGEKPLCDVLQIAHRAQALAEVIQNEEIKAHAAWALTEIFHALGDRPQAANYLHLALTIYEAQGKHLDAEQIRQFMAQYGYQLQAK